MAELLLKRTTATAAAKVYDSFLTRFPSLRDIAIAPNDELVHALSGLGLQHQRARDMKGLAKWFLAKHGGRIPLELESLLEAPGIGSYSAAAVLSFGHDIPTAIVDTNVERVLIRVYGNSLSHRPTRRRLTEVANGLLPNRFHREYNYGLLDLGRKICRYSDPKCGECPLDSICDYFEDSAGERKHDEVNVGATGRAARLRAARRERGFSLSRLAKVAKVSKLTIIHIESGRTAPRTETVEKLARALQVSPETLS